MFSKKIDLDKPFKTGETVQTTTSFGAIAEGTQGKVRLSNGLGVYRRYWVRFDEGKVVGQIDHTRLVRPKHKAAWLQREEERAIAAEQTEVEAVATSTEGAAGGSGNALGIPEVLLERSRAAKKRLLG